MLNLHGRIETIVAALKKSTLNYKKKTIYFLNILNVVALWFVIKIKTNSYWN